MLILFKFLDVKSSGLGRVKVHLQFLLSPNSFDLQQPVLEVKVLAVTFENIVPFCLSLDSGWLIRLAKWNENIILC